MISFIEKANQIHNNLFNYDLVEYKNNKTKIKIICKEHGVFEQTPNDHLGGHGCPKCKAKNISKRYNMGIKIFLERAKTIHKNKYDYTLVDYKNIDTKIKIICKEHGVFEQTPYLHLKGSGCKKCYFKNSGDRNKLSTSEFITKAKKIHGDLYDYNLVEYINQNTKVKIICKKHGVFEKIPHVHLFQKSGCHLCTLENLKILKTQTTKEFIEKAKKIHGDLYDYSKTKYSSVNDKIIINCKKHGDFLQLPYDHLYGKGCQKCSKGRISKLEKELLDFIKQNYSKEIIENSKKIIPPYELDIYLPDLKLAIEFNGLYWHCEAEKENNYHLLKTITCEQNNIHLIQIYEDDWIYKSDIIKSRILNLLGKSIKIFARKCKIKEVNNKDSKEFQLKNHLQGNVNSKINLGLYYNNELVSLMTLGSLRRNLGYNKQENHYELLRFCNKLNNSVVGGANKLFKDFINKHNPDNIISYTDRSWTMNNGKTLYDKLKFKFINETKPNYHYVINGKKENRFNYRKDILVKEGYDSSKSEHQIMKERRIYRIYDSGNLKYQWNK